eukprot:gene1396-1541_t
MLSLRPRITLPNYKPPTGKKKFIVDLSAFKCRNNEAASDKELSPSTTDEEVNNDISSSHIIEDKKQKEIKGKPYKPIRPEILPNTDHVSNSISKTGRRLVEETEIQQVEENKESDESKMKVPSSDENHVGEASVPKKRKEAPKKKRERRRKIKITYEGRKRSRIQAPRKSTR